MAQKLVKQTRRSISVRGVTYDTLRQFCDDTQRSMSDVIEELLGSLFAKNGLEAAPAPKAKLEKADRTEKLDRKVSAAAAQLAASRSRTIKASDASRGRAVANRVARSPQVSPEESEAIRKKYSIPTGDESTAVMGRPTPTPIGSYLKPKKEAAVGSKDHRIIRF